MWTAPRRKAGDSRWPRSLSARAMAFLPQHCGSRLTGSSKRRSKARSRSGRISGAGRPAAMLAALAATRLTRSARALRRAGAAAAGGGPRRRGGGCGGGRAGGDVGGFGGDQVDAVGERLAQGGGGVGGGSPAQTAEGFELFFNPAVGHESILLFPRIPVLHPRKGIGPPAGPANTIEGIQCQRRMS